MTSKRPPPTGWRGWRCTTWPSTFVGTLVGSSPLHAAGSRQTTQQTSPREAGRADGEGVTARGKSAARMGWSNLPPPKAETNVLCTNSRHSLGTFRLVTLYYLAGYAPKKGYCKSLISPAATGQNVRLQRWAPPKRAWRRTPPRELVDQAACPIRLARVLEFTKTGVGKEAPITCLLLVSL